MFSGYHWKKWKGNPHWINAFLNFATHIRAISKLQQPKFHWKNNEKIKFRCGGYMSLRCECIWNAEAGTWASLWVYMKRVFMSKMSIQISERKWIFAVRKWNYTREFLTNTSQSKFFIFSIMPTQGSKSLKLRWRRQCEPDKRWSLCFRVHMAIFVWYVYGRSSHVRI